MKEVHREEHIAMLTRGILGNVIAVGALKGMKAGDLTDTITKLSVEMIDIVEAKPDKIAKQLQAAKDRYVFIA